MSFLDIFKGKKDEDNIKKDDYNFWNILDGCHCVDAESLGIEEKVPESLRDLY